MAPSAGGGGAAAAAAAGGPAAHVWEETNVENTWESAVQEDEDGRLVVASSRDSLTALLRQRRRRLEQNDYALRHKRLRRDMIRYLYFVLDASRWMRQKDPVLPPATRLEATLNLLEEFCQAYYDENPLSHLGFVVVRNGEAEILSKLSTSSKAHKLALQSIGALVASDNKSNGGEFSLQNGLEVAGRSLGHQPRHGSREIVVLTAALSTCDPGYLLTETLPRLLQAQIRVSAFAISAELHVCRKLTEETSGSMGVCLDRGHYREWLMSQTVPPPTKAALTDDESGAPGVVCEMVPMGFPSRTVAPLPSLVHATRDKTILVRTAYTCPQCQAPNAELPTDCAVCGLKLVLSPHLARSFHHLFPVPPFIEVATIQDTGRLDKKKRALVPSSTMSTSSSSVPGLLLNDQLLVNSNQDDTCCFACLRPLVSHNFESGKNEWLRFACPECENVFCFDCDAFLHGTLHNCPGCLAN